VKFSIFLAPQIPPGGDPATRRRLAPIGRNTEHYQMMLEELREIAVAADQLGFDAIMLTEHHFHSEGLEASTNPLLLLADLAARTERIMLAPLGMVLPAWDPVRAAEDVAILDQLCRGRLALGIARGYQPRWSSTLFQSRNVQPTDSRAGGIEDRNQEVFGEILKIMKLCWTQDTVRYRSEILDGYSIPFPYEGIAHWPPREWTREFGAPGEVDPDGVLRRVCVVPRPYQVPHPKLWQPFAISERTVRRCAELEIMPYILAPRPEDFGARCRAFLESARAAGRDLELGEDTGTLNFILLGEDGEDQDELIRMGERCVAPDWVRFFGEFGYGEALRLPDDPYPVGQMPRHAMSFARFEQSGLALVGTADEVRRRIDALRRQAPPDWFGVQLGGLQGVAPLDWVKRQLELIAKHILPEYRD
jgi:alkanesulfonate monooxygenase SsuD/methylene tetrahydromethanopterin reductase-like flavin-dependent oxidoreductase (luciferase family)